MWDRNWPISKSQAALCYETFDSVTPDVTCFYIAGIFFFFFFLGNRHCGTLFFPHQTSILDFAA